LLSVDKLNRLGLLELIGWELKVSLGKAGLSVIEDLFLNASIPGELESRSSWHSIEGGEAMSTVVLG